MRSLHLLVPAAVLLALAAPARAETREHPSLLQIATDGSRTELPLVRGAVHVSVRGPIAQVRLTQTYANPGTSAIEAVYVFPLPHDGAVGGMTMRLGERTITASIRRRDEARAVYQQARDAGQATALLEQERPNIFTQSVANILPGEEIDVDLTYDLLLAPTEDVWELAIPTVVAPRYIPDGVTDADRITPPSDAAATNPMRFDLDIQNGLPIAEVYSPTHTIVTTELADTHYQVALAGSAMNADRDFVLRWRVAVTRPALAVLADKRPGAALGHLALIVQPPPATEDSGPRELVFVVDTSGSMEGPPLDLAKEAMRWALARLGPDDTFRILHFSDHVSGLDDGASLRATDDEVARGLAYVEALHSDGGTEVLPALRAALAGEHAGRTRYVCFMSDGDVGNETEILADLDERLGSDAHFFSFGIGSSANRYVLDELARHGHGVAQVLLLDQDPAAQVEQVFAQVEAPALQGLTVEWDGVTVSDASPAALPDLFSGQPLVIAGRYAAGGKGTVRVHGTRGGREITLRIPVILPDNGGDGDVLGRLWARRRIAETTDEAAITELALTYSLMSAYTSFVAVENGRRTDGTPTTVEVPVAVPYGMSGDTSAENLYVVDGVNTTGLSYAMAGSMSYSDIAVLDRRLTTRRHWRGSVDVGGAISLDGDQGALSLSAGIEHRDSHLRAIGITAAVWNRDLRTLLVTLARWAMFGPLDVRLGAGAAWFVDEGVGLAWQARVALPLGNGGVAPELELRLDGTTFGEDDLVGAGLGIGLRF
jgi:Ca-activated chloride channel family protein